MRHLSLLALAVPLLTIPAIARAGSIRLSAAAKGEVLREEAGSDSRTVKISFRMREARLTPRKGFAELAVDGLPLSSDLGMPRLPFQAVTLDAPASAIRVRAELGSPVEIKAGKIFPAQEEPCRCAEPPGRLRVFQDRLAQYSAEPAGFRIESLGDFRGQPVSRVLLFPHRYDARRGRLLLYPNARFEISQEAAASPAQRPGAEALYDYLVITPRDLMGGLADWVSWKRDSQGLRFNVVAYEETGAGSAAALKGWIHAEYARAQFRYALIVGGKNRIPQMTVETSTDRNTPSDLPYFTMGDAADVIPEAYAGRVVANDPDTLSRILRKWMDYERDSSSAPGWRRAVGIASNEGSNPSDAEYVTAVQQRFASAFGTESVYLYQNNSDSNPGNFNAQLATGAMWVTYLGHGSGTNWPSFGQSYGIPDIQSLRNASAVKPVWIDVACLNGALEADRAGAHLTADVDPSGSPIGVVAYYGGTVLISWHPPAIFARGVAFKLPDMLRPTLGEALQAGQRYLTENTTNTLDIASNQRWYHLQGDPSMRLRTR